MNPGIAPAAQGMGAGPAPGGIATPMMAQPMMPAQPMMGQPMMPAQPAQPAAPQGLASAVAPFRGLPSKMLLPIFAANPNFATLAALSEAQKEEQIAAQVRGQQAIEAAKQMQGTVAQDLVKKVASQGIGPQQYGYARGGIVAFQDGGAVDPYPAEGQELQRLGRKYGITLSPYDSAEVRAQKIQRIRSMVEFDRGMDANRAEIPTAQGQATQQLLSQAYQDPSRRQDVYTAPKPAATAPVRPAPGAGAGPTTRPAGAQPAPGAGPVARPPAATAGAAAPDDPFGYRAASADMFKTMQGAGGVSDEEKQFRQALLEAMQAERQTPQEYKEPKGVSGRELLELAGSLNLEKGEGFGSLARGTAGILEKREAKKAEAMKANREIDAANRKLNTAVAQQRLAYATGDRQARETADAAVAKARFELRKLEVQTGLDSRKVAAQEQNARAAETSARTRATPTTTLNPQQRVAILREATDMVEKDTAVIRALAKERDPIKQREIRNAAIQQQYRALLTAYGETDTTSTTPGQATAAPGATLSAEDRALIERYTAPK